MIRLKRETFFAGVMIAVTLVFLEAGLQIAAAIFPGVAALLSRTGMYPAIEDDLLGWRPNSEFMGHDPKGFRNAVVPERVFIVALGDSQTYGFGVSREEAWPKQLEMLGHITTYNMSFSGYGPTHSLALLNEALQLRPKLVIEAFYAGNDLYDSYNHVYRLKQLPYLRTEDKETLNAISEKEAAAPFPSRYSRLYAKPGAEPHRSDLREFFAEHSKIYGLFRALYEFSETVASAPPIKDSFVFHYGGLRTTLTPRYRLRAVDLSDPRIVEGHRVSLEAVRLLKEQSESNSVGFIVLLLPTKEMVFKDFVEKSTEIIPIDYQQLVENEQDIWTESKRFFQNRGICVIDALPALKKSIENGAQPYHESGDGHPTSIGQRIIAELVLSKIRNATLSTACYAKNGLGGV